MSINKKELFNLLKTNIFAAIMREINKHIEPKALTSGCQFKGIDKTDALNRSLYVHSSNYFKMK
ncbi:hypothetical protein [Tenacibaculum sp. nBUS_03]|uniref:hypothetical protein n=1 Tax=Tenacibaculum sp. nBUS_03 TaxID=3395320 RepID=UPI003EB903F3